MGMQKDRRTVDDFDLVARRGLQAILGRHRQEPVGEHFLWRRQRRYRPHRFMIERTACRDLFVVANRHASISSGVRGFEQQARMNPSAISSSRMPPLWLIATSPKLFFTLQVPHRPNSQAAEIRTPTARAAWSTVWSGRHEASTSERLNRRGKV